MNWSKIISESGQIRFIQRTGLRQRLRKKAALTELHGLFDVIVLRWRLVKTFMFEKGTFLRSIEREIYVSSHM